MTARDFILIFQTCIILYSLAIPMHFNSFNTKNLIVFFFSKISVYVLYKKKKPGRNHSRIPPVHDYSDLPYPQISSHCLLSVGQSPMKHRCCWPSSSSPQGEPFFLYMSCGQSPEFPEQYSGKSHSLVTSLHTDPLG